MEYSCTVEHVKGRINPADGLSRLPSSVQEASDDEQLVIAALTEERAVVTGAELRAASQSDPVLSKLRQQIPRQWPRRYAEVDGRRGEPVQPDGAADRTGPADAELESSGDRDRLEQQEQDRLEAIPEPETTDSQLRLDGQQLDVPPAPLKADETTSGRPSGITVLVRATGVPAGPGDESACR
ncbi:hypothetical protein FJT64_002447 [Amphibalanus amphitrite]|uniref:Uncharacterized protein n=1 Tax=Amphibalanus amphitrite TaxID=1232801 RepID=A0A6A4WRW0_AMPAM|nr:hypothetical protein FJT64_002447 [Amphibalanus amphitrite]